MERLGGGGLLTTGSFQSTVVGGFQKQKPTFMNMKILMAANKSHAETYLIIGFNLLKKPGQYCREKSRLGSANKPCDYSQLP